MPLTDIQKKWSWILGVALIAIHFAPDFLNAARRMTASSARPSVMSKPSPLHIAPLPPPPPVNPFPPQASFTRLTGFWTSAILRPTHGLCQMKLELRPKPNAGSGYTGYTTMTCGPNLGVAARAAPIAPLESMLKALMPVSAVLSGQEANGSLNLRLDQAIGVPTNGCQLNALTLTPFGESQLAARFTEDQCEGGQMVMRRSAQ